MLEGCGDLWHGRQQSKKGIRWILSNSYIKSNSNSAVYYDFSTQRKACIQWIIMKVQHQQQILLVLRKFDKNQFLHAGAGNTDL